LKGGAGDRDRRSAIHIKNSDKNREREPYRFHSDNFRTGMGSGKQRQDSPHRARPNKATDNWRNAYRLSM
jgi:hypothetical protein